MNTIDDLKKKVQSLESQLSAAKASLHAAMIASEPLKVGDIVEVTTPPSYGKTVPVVEIGRVRAVVVRYGDVAVDIAPKTKTGYHASNILHRRFNSTLRVLEPAASSENKEAL